MSWTIDAIITLLVLALAGGTASEQLANRKFFPPLGLFGAWLIAFGGALIGAWFFASVLGFTEPRLFNVPIVPALVGLLIFLTPYFMVRGGYTRYGRERTWQRKYRR